MRKIVFALVLFPFRVLPFRHLYLIVGSWLLAAGFASCGNSNRTAENSTKPDVDSMQTTCYSDVVEKEEMQVAPVESEKDNLEEKTIMITCYDTVAPNDSLQ
ncbi:MAG: hypothetical protein CVU11_09590 [Bacteroidetes bacterium HGW-Bacteroidetes-6]|jgi:hypothetical protein|nr:MAG: hypothetical protein CVU11_09590 [Bacteroidetes bacterium HGW-Bacteroidetes-6]